MVRSASPLTISSMLFPSMRQRLADPAGALHEHAFHHITQVGIRVVPE